MKKIRSGCIYFLTAVCAFMVSCQNGDVTIDVETTSEEILKITSVEGLDPTITDLEISDAEIVAKIYATKKGSSLFGKPRNY